MKKHRLLYPADSLESRWTVLQVVYALVKNKVDYQISTEGFQAMLRTFACVLPAFNELPTSMYRCKSILGVEDLIKYQWDTCPCGAHSYDPKGPPATREDRCPLCGLMRHKPDDGSGKLIPVAVRH